MPNATGWTARTTEASRGRQPRWDSSTTEPRRGNRSMTAFVSPPPRPRPGNGTATRGTPQRTPRAASARPRTAAASSSPAPRPQRSSGPSPSSTAKHYAAPFEKGGVTRRGGSTSRRPADTSPAPVAQSGVDRSPAPRSVDYARRQPSDSVEAAAAAVATAQATSDLLGSRRSVWHTLKQSSLNPHHASTSGSVGDSGGGDYASLPPPEARDPALLPTLPLEDAPIVSPFVAESQRLRDGRAAFSDVQGAPWEEGYATRHRTRRALQATSEPHPDDAPWRHGMVSSIAYSRGDGDRTAQPSQLNQAAPLSPGRTIRSPTSEGSTGDAPNAVGESKWKHSLRSEMHMHIPRRGSGPHAPLSPPRKASDPESAALPAVFERLTSSNVASPRPRRGSALEVGHHRSPTVSVSRSPPRHSARLSAHTPADDTSYHTHVQLASLDDIDGAATNEQRRRFVLERGFVEAEEEFVRGQLSATADHEARLVMLDLSTALHHAALAAFFDAAVNDVVAVAERRSAAEKESGVEARIFTQEAMDLEAAVAQTRREHDTLAAVKAELTSADAQSAAGSDAVLRAIAEDRAVLRQRFDGLSAVAGRVAAVAASDRIAAECGFTPPRSEVPAPPPRPDVGNPQSVRHATAPLSPQQAYAVAADAFAQQQRELFPEVAPPPSVKTTAWPAGPQSTGLSDFLSAHLAPAPHVKSAPAGRGLAVTAGKQPALQPNVPHVAHLPMEASIATNAAPSVWAPRAQAVSQTPWGAASTPPRPTTLEVIAAGGETPLAREAAALQSKAFHEDVMTDLARMARVAQHAEQAARQAEVLIGHPLRTSNTH